MNYEEAKLELNGITEIHRKSWDRYNRVFIDLNERIRYRGKDEQPEEFDLYMPRLEDLSCTDWEIYQDPDMHTAGRVGQLKQLPSQSVPTSQGIKEFTPVIMTIQTTVDTGMEPMAQLLSVLFDTLNHSAFDDLPLSAKARALRFIADGYN